MWLEPKVCKISWAFLHSWTNIDITSCRRIKKMSFMSTELLINRKFKIFKALKWKWKLFAWNIFFILAQWFPKANTWSTRMGFLDIVPYKCGYSVSVQTINLFVTTIFYLQICWTHETLEMCVVSTTSISYNNKKKIL